MFTCLSGQKHPAVLELSYCMPILTYTQDRYFILSLIANPERQARRR